MNPRRLIPGIALTAIAIAAEPDGLAIYQLRCAACHDHPTERMPTRDTLANANWNGWGRDFKNSRYHPSPGINAADVPKLTVKWASGYPGTFTYGQPTVIGDRLYVTSGIGTVYALNAQTGRTYWTFASGKAPARP